MLISVYESSTPSKQIVGNAAWLLLHRAPYQAETFGKTNDVLTEQEKNLAHTAGMPAVYARRYAAMASSLVAAYPCSECRTSAANSKQMQHVLASLHSYANTCGGQPGRAVADELAVFAFKLHNAAQPPEPEHYAERSQAKSLRDMERSLEERALPSMYVKALMRARWAPVIR